ncbi:MAG TPA: 4Fe-4S ferredoxin, partial [Anaeromyxobacteraceae bacterium]
MSAETKRSALPVLPTASSGEVDLAPDLRSGEPVSPERRAFLRTAAAGAALATLSGCGLETLFRKSFRELSPADVKDVLGRAQAKSSAKYGKAVSVSGTPARAGVEFGYGLDLSRCVGCRRCVYACVKENNQSRKNPQIHWIRV